jgi:hypothetical protein
MTGKVEKIIRTEPRDGIEETPVCNRDGKFVLAHDDHGDKKHHKESKDYADTLEQVADMIARGYHVRMGRKGKSPSMIAPDSLRIVWA